MHSVLVITKPNTVSPVWVPIWRRTTTNIQEGMIATEHVLKEGCSSHSSIWICRKYDTESCDEEKGTARLYVYGVLFTTSWISLKEQASYHWVKLIFLFNPRSFIFGHLWLRVVSHFPPHSFIKITDNLLFCNTFEANT